MKVEIRFTKLILHLKHRARKIKNSVSIKIQMLTWRHYICDFVHFIIILFYSIVFVPV